MVLKIFLFDDDNIEWKEKISKHKEVTDFISCNGMIIWF